MHPSTRRRMAAAAGRDPREPFYAQGEPAPPPPEVSDFERAVVNLASNPDFQVFMRDAEKEFINLHGAIDRAGKDLFEIGRAQGRADVFAKLKATVKAVEDRLGDHRRQHDAWRRSQSSG